MFISEFPQPMEGIYKKIPLPSDPKFVKSLFNYKQANKNKVTLL